MNFRAAQPSDARAMSDIVMSHRTSMTVHRDGAGAERFLQSVSEEAIRGYVADARYRYLVAEHEGGIAGFIAMRDGTHLYHLFVAAAHQGQGIARRLWENARTEALAAGATGEFTVNSSLAAVQVYRRFGFRETGPCRREAGVAFVPMRLQPASPADGEVTTA
jgi:GNAT superfamily N-acetyltransferase